MDRHPLPHAVSLGPTLGPGTQVQRCRPPRHSHGPRLRPPQAKLSVPEPQAPAGHRPPRRGVPWRPPRRGHWSRRPAAPPWAFVSNPHRARASVLGFRLLAHNPFSTAHEIFPVPIVLPPLWRPRRAARPPPPPLRQRNRPNDNAHAPRTDSQNRKRVTLSFGAAWLAPSPSVRSKPCRAGSGGHADASSSYAPRFVRTALVPAFAFCWGAVS